MNVPTLLRYHVMEPVVNPKYDSIVDRTDFKKGQDKERAQRLTGDTGGSMTAGVYDFPDGKISEKTAPTDLELSLRSGRLDKADIDTLSRIQQKSAANEAKQRLSDKALADEKAINDARQSYLDQRTGFDKASVKSE